MNSHPFSIDAKVYEEMLALLNGLHFTDKYGALADLAFLGEDEWLADTAVIERVVRRKGTWEVHLVFAHFRQPLRFLARHITSNASQKKALLTATYMRRLAAKDQRGTLKIDPDLFQLPRN